MKKNNFQYIAKTGSEAKERLTLQHRVFAPGTELLLEMASFKPNMRILVVGCGCGDETIMIAKQLNTQGQIVAIDNSHDQIEEAKQAAKIVGVSDKISFLQKSVYNLNTNEGEFDLIICRFVIPHFEDPIKAIKILKDRLCYGGKLAVQEPLVSTCTSEPESPALSHYIKLMMTFGKLTHRDFDMALNFPDIFEACGLKTHFQRWRPLVVGDDKRMVAMSAAECMPAICKLSLATEEEAKNLIKEIESEVVNRDNVVLLQCENILVVGEK